MNQIYEKYSEQRKRLKILMIIWIALRAVMLIIEISARLHNQTTAAIILLFIGMLVCACFAGCIVNGMKKIAYLPMIGGISMIINGLRNIATIGNISLLTGMQKMYIYYMMFCGAIQIVLMVIAMTDKRNKPYFDEVQIMQKQTVAENRMKQNLRK